MTRACLRYAREGQNVTQAGPKCHTSKAKMSHKGQNVTQSCYNLAPYPRGDFQLGSKARLVFSFNHVLYFPAICKIIFMF